MSASDKIVLINNITAILLVIIALTASTSSILEERKRVARFFGGMIIINIAVDMIDLYAVGKGFDGIYGIVLALNSLNLILRMVTACFLAYYEYSLEGNRLVENTKKEFLIVFTPVIFGVIFIFINLFTGIVFSVDMEGYYTNNTGIYIIHGIVILYLFAAIFMSLFGRNNVALYPFVSMFVLVIPVAIGVIMRSFLLPDVPVGFLGGAISLIIYVISMSNAGALYDPSTKIYNKEYMEYFLRKAEKDPQNRVAGIMLDVNNLKMINEKYGHKAGDGVLLKTVELIKNMRIKNSALVRFGGDEFILLLSVTDIETVRDVMLNIKERLFEYEAEDTAPYKLSLSMGTTLHIPGENVSSFVRRMDEQMYYEKKAFHDSLSAELNKGFTEAFTQ